MYETKTIHVSLHYPIFYLHFLFKSQPEKSDISAPILNLNYQKLISPLNKTLVKPTGNKSKSEPTVLKQSQGSIGGDDRRGSRHGGDGSLVDERDDFYGFRRTDTGENLGHILQVHVDLSGLVHFHGPAGDDVVGVGRLGMMNEVMGLGLALVHRRDVHHHAVVGVDDSRR